ncbi:MAG: exosome complex RNA-binding protein Csl4 [Candidatus Diapherotrites archaeon]
MSDKNIAFPGDFLSTEEEYMPGKNTYVSDEGDVCSDSLGKSEIDTTEKSVSVEKMKNIEMLDVGTIVYVRVSMLKPSSVFVEIFAAEKDGKKRVVPSAMAAIPVRNISREYVEKLGDFFGIGDIVKAKVSFYAPYGIDLRTNEQELGVIKAFCKKCRKPLYLFGKQLKCRSCASNEQRKIANDYMLK